VVSYSQVTAE